jgi:hypothetical protein
MGAIAERTRRENEKHLNADPFKSFRVRTEYCASVEHLVEAALIKGDQVAHI